MHSGEDIALSAVRNHDYPALLSLLPSLQACPQPAKLRLLQQILADQAPDHRPPRIACAIELASGLGREAFGSRGEGEPWECLVQLNALLLECHDLLRDKLFAQAVL
jgi:hypothetical protein